MAEQQHCSKEADLARLDQRVTGVEDITRGIHADIRRIFEKLDSNPTWKAYSFLTFLLGIAVTVIAGFIAIGIGS